MNGKESGYCGPGIPPDHNCMSWSSDAHARVSMLRGLCYVGNGGKTETRPRLWIHPWVRKMGGLERQRRWKHVCVDPRLEPEAFGACAALGSRPSCETSGTATRGRTRGQEVVEMRANCAADEAGAISAALRSSSGTSAPHCTKQEAH